MLDASSRSTQVILIHLETVGPNCIEGSYCFIELTTHLYKSGGQFFCYCSWRLERLVGDVVQYAGVYFMAYAGPYRDGAGGYLAGNGLIIQVVEIGLAATTTGNDDKLDIECGESVQRPDDGFFGLFSLHHGISQMNSKAES